MMNKIAAGKTYLLSAKLRLRYLQFIHGIPYNLARQTYRMNWLVVIHVLSYIYMIKRLKMSVSAS